MCISYYRGGFFEIHKIRVLLPSGRTLSCGGLAAAVRRGAAQHRTAHRGPPGKEASGKRQAVAGPNAPTSKPACLFYWDVSKIIPLLEGVGPAPHQEHSVAILAQVLDSKGVGLWQGHRAPATQ